MQLKWDDDSRHAATIQLGNTFRDYQCSAALGDVKEWLKTKKRPKKITVDMSSLGWADPLPLLSLGALLHTVGKYGSEVIINIGASSVGDISHRVFLRFLASQGFISAYSNFAKFLFGGFTYSLRHESDEEDIEDLVYELSRFQQPTNYRNSDCIFAKIIGVNDYRDDSIDHEKLQKKVEELVKEANNRLIDNAYSRNPLIRDRLLQKIRKILFELLSNSVDHAYPEKLQGGYVGVFARMRAELPDSHEEAKAWQDLYSLERGGCPGFCVNGVSLLLRHPVFELDSKPV